MTKKRIRSRQCICDHAEQCQGMSLAFQMLGDPRGGHVDVPPAAACKPEYEYLHRMNELRKAYFRHLVKKNEQQSYVALHHFHPKLVRQLAEASGGTLVQVPPTLKSAEIRRLGWQPLEANRVCDVNGQLTDEYFFVPNYPMEDAYRDLKRLSRAQRSTQDISTDVYQNAKRAIEARRKNQNGSNGKTETQQPKKQERRKDKASEVPKRSAQDSNISADKAKMTTVRLKTLDSQASVPNTIITQTNSKPSDFKVIGIPEEGPVPSDLGDSNATLPGESRTRAAMDASGKTLEGSYNLLAAYETRRRYGSIKPGDLGASDSAVAGAGLYSSVVSLQVTDAALQKSATTLNASDLTVQASGTGPATKQLNASDSTVQASNTSAVPSGELSDKLLDFPCEELPPRSPKSKAKSIPLQSSSSAALDPPLEELPRRRSEVLPACETLSDRSPTKRNSSVVDCKDKDNDADNPTDGASRFCSLPKAIKVNDSSPMTPRRMVSRRSLHSEDDDDEEEEEEPQSSICDDQAPYGPKGKQCLLDLDVEEALTQPLGGFTQPRISPMTPVKEELETTNHSRSRSKNRSRRSVSALSASDVPEAPTLRRGSTTQLKILKERGKQSASPKRTRSGQSGCDSKDPPERSWSGDSTFRRRRKSQGTPQRSKSDSVGSLRRRSDTIARRGTTGYMSDSSGRSRSKLGIRRIDTTDRAMKQFCQGFDSDDDQKNRGRRLPRRVRSDISRARSDTPTREVRRGRRPAVVPSDGGELLHGSCVRKTRRTLRRSKSADSRDSAHGKRSSDQSSSRLSDRPRRGVRRTKSLDPLERISGRSRIQKNKENRKPSLSPRRSRPVRTRSELSPHRNIRRLDTTKRAMLQFVNDTGIGSELSADHSPRRAPRHTRSQLGRKRGSRSRSPMRTKGSDPNMNSSSPAVLGSDNEVHRTSFHERLGDLSSSSQTETAPLPLQRAITESCPGGLDMKRWGTRIDGSVQSLEPAQSQCSGDRRLDQNGSDVKSSLSTSDLSDLNELRLQCASQASAEACKPSEAAECKHQSITAEYITKKNVDAAEAASETPKVCTLSESLHPEDLWCEGSKANCNQQSLTLDDATKEKTGPNNAAAGILEGFHFSYPLPDKSERTKDVDWEAIGFYSSITAIQRETSIEEEKGPTTFGLPWRLIAKKARQTLLAEVVMTAHRRQTVAAKKLIPAKSAMRRESQMLREEMLAAVKEMEEAKMDFGEQVAKKADALLKGDRAGQLDAHLRASLEGVQGQGTSLMSLSLDRVFEESQEFSVAESPDRPTSKPKKPSALGESALSLSLRGVFQNSDLSRVDSVHTLPNGSEMDKSGSWAAEQLRTVFPFKTLRDKMKGGSSRLTDESFLSVESQGETWKERVPALQDHVAPQTASEKPSSPPPIRPARRPTKEDMVDCMASITSELCMDKLPDISEEELEQETSPLMVGAADDVAIETELSIPDSSPVSGPKRARNSKSTNDLPPLEPMRRRGGTATKPNQEVAASQKSNVTAARKSIEMPLIEMPQTPIPADMKKKMASLLQEVKKASDHDLSLSLKKKMASLLQEEKKASDYDLSLSLKEKMASLLQEKKKASHHDLSLSLPTLMQPNHGRPTPIPTGTKEKMASLLQNEHDLCGSEQDLSVSLSTPPNHETEQPTKAEFKLSFPPALVLGSRALPTTADVCLSPFSEKIFNR